MDAHALVNRYMKELNVKAVFIRPDIWTERNPINTSLIAGSTSNFSLLERLAYFEKGEA